MTAEGVPVQPHNPTDTQTAFAWSRTTEVWWLKTRDVTYFFSFIER